MNGDDLVVSPGVYPRTPDPTSQARAAMRAPCLPSGSRSRCATSRTAVRWASSSRDSTLWLELFLRTFVHYYLLSFIICSHGFLFKAYEICKSWIMRSLGSVRYSAAWLELISMGCLVQDLPESISVIDISDRSSPR